MTSAEFAPGIPVSRAVARLPSVSGAQTWEFTLQSHLADRAGQHFDMRLGEPGTSRAHSWALRYWPKIGEVRLAVQQPTHTRAYMDFSGSIASGYGKGSVSLARRERAEVHSSDDSHVRFSLYPGSGVEEYLLRRTAGNSWILRNVTPQRGAGRPIPSHKPKYRESRIADLDLSSPDTVVQAKIDGAHALFDFTHDRPQAYSYRAGKKRDLIIHTPRVPEMVGKRTPPELRGAVIRGELAAVDSRGKALPAARVGGMLNAGVWKSREAQDREGLIVPYAFDVSRWRGRDAENLPYAEKQVILDTVRRHAPWLRAPTSARTTAAKERLVAAISAGREPSTDEGVVVWRDSESLPTKAKVQREVDVFVRKIFAETGARNQAGGFEYSLSPRGPVVGRVGTGFSHALKTDMLVNPSRYLGLRARVVTTPAPGHYALRAPVFKTWHLDQSLPAGVKTASLADRARDMIRS
jgi:hypothetical protein